MEQNLNDKTACLVTAFQSGDVSAFSTLYDMMLAFAKTEDQTTDD